MAGQLLLLNPASRRKSRKPRTAAQKAATRRMLAANRARRAGGKANRKTAKHHAVSTYAANPVKRRTRRAASKIAARRTRRYNRNPIGLPSMSNLIGMLKDAAIGGAGAVGVDLAMGQVAPHLPAGMTSKYDADGSINWQYSAVKVALAVAVGTVAPKFLPGKLKSIARKAAEGSLTVQAYDIVRHSMPSTMTLGFMQPAQTVGGENVIGMGKYLEGRGMGKYLEGTGAGSADPLYAQDQRVGEGTIL